MITKLCKLFPISKIVIEDVKFNHYKSVKGRAFSIAEQGKTALYDFINFIGLKLELYNGFNTKKLRINSFGVDLKEKLKNSKSFEAHCIDSFVLACNKSNVFDINSGEIDINEPIITNEIYKVNRKVLFIEKIVKIRRCLMRLRKRYNDAKYYFKKLKGGIKEIYRNFSSHRNICRIKLDGEHSNHPKIWKYLDLGFVERFKCFIGGYDGTRINGKSFFRNNEWENRVLCLI